MTPFVESQQYVYGRVKYINCILPSCLKQNKSKLGLELTLEG